MDYQDDTRHSSTRFHRRCYNIDTEHLKRIVGVIRDRTRGDVDISMSLDASEVISGKSLDTILQSSLLNVMNIDEIRLRADRISSNELEGINLLYRRSNMVGAIRVIISGKTDAVVAAREEIDRIIMSTSRWYWPLNYKGSAIAFLAYVLVLGIISLISAAYVLASQFELTLVKNHPNLMGGVYMMLTFFISSAIWYLRDTFFPVMEFRIGKSGIGADRRDVLRKYVFVTALGGIFLSFIGRIVWDRLAAFMPQVK